MPHLLSIILVGWLYVSTAGAQEIWRCVQPNGTEIFVDQRKDDLKDCRRYNQKGQISKMDTIRDTRTKPPAFSGETRATIEPRFTEPAPPMGQIDSATFNKLSVGMTEAAVMGLAGQPKAKFPGTWIYSMDTWTVELRFGGGPPALAEIRQYQTVK
jgi:hypothetical protein